MHSVSNTCSFTLCLYVSHSYAVPLTVALGSFILRWLADATCSPYSTVCKKSSDFLSHIYAVVIIFLLIVAATKAKQGKEMLQKVKGAVQLLSDGGKAKKD
jgi:hypothetical protein